MSKGKTPPGSRAKTTKSHTTAIDVVETLLPFLNRLGAVEKIALGIIKPKLKPAPRRIKIVSEKPTVLLLKMRGTNSLQEVRVYTSDAKGAQKAIETFARKKKWGIT